MPDMKLDAADAAELAEILQFLSGWLARDPARFGASLDDFVGHPAYGISQLRQDLERFCESSGSGRRIAVRLRRLASRHDPQRFRRPRLPW
jgi:hypothetical protein